MNKQTKRRIFWRRKALEAMLLFPDATNDVLRLYDLATSYPPFIPSINYRPIFELMGLKHCRASTVRFGKALRTLSDEHASSNQ